MTRLPGKARCRFCNRDPAPVHRDRYGVEVYQTHHAKGSEETCYLSKDQPVAPPMWRKP